MKRVNKSKMRNSINRDSLIGLQLINRIPIYAPLSECFLEWEDFSESQLKRNGKQNKFSIIKDSKNHTTNF